MTPRYTVLTEEEIDEADLKDWQVVGGKLTAQFNFANFNQAMAFMGMVAIEAEILDHHPEWSNVNSKVDIKLITHYVDKNTRDVITDRDVALAKYISETAKTFQPV